VRRPGEERHGAGIIAAVGGALRSTSGQGINNAGKATFASEWIPLHRRLVDGTLRSHPEHAKQARGAAHLATDPITKARLHQIANDLCSEDQGCFQETRSIDNCAWHVSAPDDSQEGRQGARPPGQNAYPIVFCGVEAFVDEVPSEPDYAGKKAEGCAKIFLTIIAARTRKICCDRQ
jgi:hypothetical protein